MKFFILNLLFLSTQLLFSDAHSLRRKNDDNNYKKLRKDIIHQNENHREYAIDLEEEESQFFRVLESSMSLESPSSTTSNDDPTPPSSPSEEDQLVPSGSTIWDVINSRSDEFSTFIAAAETADIDYLWKDNDRQFTLFLPTNAAFAAVQPTDLLSRYLDVDSWGTSHIAAAINFHSVQGKVVYSSGLENNTVAIPETSLMPSDVTVTIPPPMLSNSMMATPANIVELDVTATNGVIHVVDQVIISGFLRVNAMQAAIATGSFNILIELIEIAGLTDIVNGPGPMTIFAPPDSVFEAYGEKFIQGLRNDPTTTQELLLHHVALGEIVCGCASTVQTVLSARGYELVIVNQSEGDGGFTVNEIQNAQGYENFLLVSNAVIGVISNLLIPPDFKRHF